jgi:dihydropteroate synthase
MQSNPTYSNVVNEVKTFLLEKVKRAKSKGVEVWVDPGIGFGKTFQHNIELLSGTKDLVELGVPVVIGASRKSFIREVTGEEIAENRDDASIAIALWCAQQGAQALRVHNVRETLNALKTWDYISSFPTGSK